MEDILKFLKKLELSDVEAKLYLTLLQHGPTSVRELAETINIKRTTTYFYIDQLIEKGLIIKMVQGSKKQVAANPPESLHHLVEQKVASAKQVEQTFPKILETIAITLPYDNQPETAEIKYYKGKNSVQKIYEDALSTKELRSYVNLAEIAEIFPENFSLFDTALRKNEDMLIYEIVEDSPEARKRSTMSDKRERHMYKYLPKNMKLTAQDILIYDDKVAIINFKNTINGMVLNNVALNTNLTMLFNIIWEILPDSN